MSPYDLPIRKIVSDTATTEPAQRVEVVRAWRGDDKGDPDVFVAVQDNDWQWSVMEIRVGHVDDYKMREVGVFRDAESAVRAYIQEEVDLFKRIESELEEPL